MKVTQVIRENDGFDDSSDEEFMHIAKQYYASYLRKNPMI